MDSKTYTITLAGGTVLDNLKLNGNNFISNTPINADIFNENCSPIIISDGVNSETYNNMELVQITEQEPGKYWFVLRELSAFELAWIKMQSETSNKFGVATHDYGGAAADWVLNDSEQKCLILVATNSGGNANIILPKKSGLVYLVDNKTDYNIVCKSVGDVAGTTILSGNSGLIYNI